MIDKKLTVQAIDMEMQCHRSLQKSGSLGGSKDYQRGLLQGLQIAKKIVQEAAELRAPDDLVFDDLVDEERVKDFP